MVSLRAYTFRHRQVQPGVLIWITNGTSAALPPFFTPQLLHYFSPLFVAWFKLCWAHGSEAAHFDLPDNKPQEPLKTSRCPSLAPGTLSGMHYRMIRNNRMSSVFQARRR